MQLSKNAIGNLIKKYKAVLKKCRLLNTFGSLAIASMLVAGSVGVAYANNVNIAGFGDNKPVSLNADDGSPASADTVTTAVTDTSGIPTSGTFNLNIDGRTLPLYTMTIGADALGGNLTVTLEQGKESTTQITSSNLNVVADTDDNKITTNYIISTDLTHTVNGKVSLQGSTGTARLDVNGILELQTPTSGSGTTIEGTRGVSNTSQLYVTNGTLKATNGTSDEILHINHLNVTLDGATVDATSLILDETSVLTLEGTNTINGNLDAGYNNIIIQGKNDGGAAESLTAASLTTKGNVQILGGNAGVNGLGASASLTLNGDGYITSSVTVQGGTAHGASAGGIASLNVNGADKIISMSDLTVNAGGVVGVSNGATLDISAVTDLSKVFSGRTFLSDGTLKVESLTIDATDLIVSNAFFVGQIAFSPTNGGTLSVNETLTLDSDTAAQTVTLASGINIETKTLVGGLTSASASVIAATLQSGASLTFSGGGSMDIAVTVDGVVNIEGSDEAGVTNAANQTNIAIDDTLTLNNGVINIQNNGVLVLDSFNDLTLAAGVGAFNVKNDGTLIVASALFDGKNITTIAGTVIVVGNATAPTFDYEDLNLANVNIQGGAKLGNISPAESLKGYVTTLLSGTINVDANSTGDKTATVFGNLRGNGVTVSDFAGTLNVSNNYLSRTGNTWGTVGNGGILNIANIADFYAGANDVFNVAFNAGTVQVYGGNSGNGDASVTVNGGGAIGAVGATNTNLTLYGGDANNTANGDNAIFIVSGGEYTVNGNVEFHNGIDTAAHTGGSATLNILGGAGADATGTTGTNTTLTVNGKILGTGTLNLQGGAGGAGGNVAGAVGGAGGTAGIDVKGTIADTITFTYTGGTGGTGGTVAGATGGKGGDFIISPSSGSYTLTGGDGGDSNVGDGGAGGAAILQAADNSNYGTVTLNGGTAGSGANGGAGGNAIFNVTNESITAEKIIMSTAQTSIVNVTVDADATNPTAQNTTLRVGEIDGTDADTDVGASGVINIAGTNDHTATLTVTGSGGSYIDDDALKVNIGLNGTLDLSSMSFASLFNYLSGAYNLDGGTLKLGALRIDAADLVSGEAAAGEIGFANGGKLDVDGLLIIRNATTTAQLNDGIHIETQSLEGNLTGSDSVTHILLGQDGSTVGSTLTFSGDNVGAIPVSNININLTIAGAAQMVVGYTLDDTGAVSMGTTTLKADNTLTVNASGGLNVQYGATLDVSDGTLYVADNGFTKVDPDVVMRPDVLGTGGLGTLIVDNDNLGLSAIEGTISYNDTNNKVDDAFWGALEVTGLEGDTITFEEYNTFLVGGEHALIQGKNATLEFVDVKIDGLVILSELEGGAVIRDVVAIGDGVVDHGGTIIVGSVFGNNNDSIVIDKGSDLSITGEPRGGTLFTQIGATTIQVKEGTLRLGGDATDGTASVASTPLTLDTGIVLGDVADPTVTGDAATTGTVYIYGDLDMVGQTISSAMETSGNAVNVVDGGVLNAGFAMRTGDTLNVTAGAKDTSTDVLDGSTLGGVNVTGGTAAGADATVNINGTATTNGDVILTGNTGDAILNIAGVDGAGIASDTALNVNGNFTNNGGILNLTASNASTNTAGGNARLDVEGIFTSTTKDINLTGGDASGDYDGGDISMSLGSAELGDVNVTSGTDDAAVAIGVGGYASFTLSHGSVAHVTVTNTSAADNVNTGFYVNTGAVIADSLILNTATGARQAYLEVSSHGFLTVGQLDATGSEVYVNDGTLTVTGTYTDTIATNVGVYTGGILNLSTTTDKVTGAYFVDGTLQMDTLNIASTDLVTLGNTKPTAGDITFNADGMLEAETLNLTDNATANLNAGNIITANLNTTHDVEVNVNTHLYFSGGGSINANVTTQGDVILIGTSNKADDSETAATTTTLAADKTLTITNNTGLNVYEGYALDTTQGTLKVVAGGFASTGTGQLVANSKDFGTFNLDATSTTGLLDKTNAHVQDLYFGDLVINGLSGTISQEEYESFLIGASNSLIEGTKATLKFEGVSVDYADDTTLDELAAGTNADDQIFKTGAESTPGSDNVDVDNGGKVVVGGVEQSDPNNPVDLNIKTDTTLVVTGQGEAQGNAFDGNVTVESGAGFETGAFDGQYTATVGGDIILEGQNLTTGAAGGQYVAVGNSTVQGSILDDSTSLTSSTGGQVVEVEAGASLTVTGKINLPAGTVEVQGGSLSVQGGNGINVEQFVMTSHADNKATLSTTTLTIGKYAEIQGAVNVEEATLNGVAFIGSSEHEMASSFSSQKTTVKGFMISDPNFDATPTLSEATSSAFDDLTITGGGFIAVQNSLMALGTGDTTLLASDLKGKVIWGPDGTTAAMGFYKAVNLPDTALLHVDGSLKTVAVLSGKELQDASGITLVDSTGTLTPYAANAGLEVGHATFAANSLALIDATAFQDSAVNTVINGASKGKLNVDASSKLVIVDGINGQVIDLTEGFASENIAQGGWAGENLIISSSLMGAELVLDAADGYVVKLTSIDANDVYTALTPSMGNHINNMVLELGTNVNSLNAGQRFISRLMDNSGVYGYGSARHTEVASIIESAAQMAQVGAVNRGIMDAAMSAGNASIARNTFAELGANAQNVTTVHMGEGGGISTGSETAGMKNGLGLWLMPLYKWNNVSGYQTGSFEHDYTSGLGGLAIGADYTVNNMFRFGVNFNLGAGYAESTGDLSQTDNSFDFWGVGVYGAFSQNNFNLVADLGYSKTYNELSQKVPSTLGMNNNSVEVNASAFTLGLTAEYVFKTDAVDIIPHAGVRFMSVTTEDYDVKNGGTVFEVENETQNVWYFPVGITLQKDVAMDNGWHFTPKLNLGFIAAAGDFDAVSKASIPGVSGSAELEMRNVDSFAFDGELGFNLGNDVVTFGINYNIQASEHETSHMISGTFRFEF